MNTSITFQDFASELNYLKLQNRFAFYDTRSVPNEDTYTKVIKKDFEIIYKDVNHITYEEDYFNKSFYKDFLFPSINNLASKYIDEVKRRLEKPDLMGRENVRLFSKSQQDKLNSIALDLTNSDYLEKRLRLLLNAQIEIATEYLTNLHIYPNNEMDSMFKFKMNRDTVILLFTMLRDRKYIDAPRDLILGRILDANFLYWDEKSESYKPFNGSGKVINNIHNHNKPANTSIAKLKLIFSEGFFNFPYL